MNALRQDLAATELDLIVGALDALLSAATAYIRERSLQPRDEEIQRAGDVAARVVAKLTTFTPAQRAADDLLHRPVSAALRQGIAVLGERLNEIGGIRAMHEAYARVTEEAGRDAARRIGIVDHTWNGIGGWMS